MDLREVQMAFPPFGHLMSTRRALKEMRRVRMISRKQKQAVTRWLDSLPTVKRGESREVTPPPPEIEPLMRDLWLVTLMPPTLTVH